MTEGNEGAATWAELFGDWEVDDSPEAREARRVAGGLREMTPVEVAERASDEVKRRLVAFEEVWELVLNHDESASAAGYGDILADSTEGRWYAKGVRETLELVRSLLSRGDA